MREILPARLELESISVKFWRITPFAGEASGARETSPGGMCPHRYIAPATDDHRAWLAHGRAAGAAAPRVEKLAPGEPR